MSLFNVWKPSNILALKFLQIIDGMNELHTTEAGKRAHYAFENTCNHGDIKCWVLKQYLFDTLVTPMLLHWVEEWGGSIPKFTWKEFENVQKHFLTKFLQVKKQTPTPSSSLRRDHFPLRSWPWKGLLHTCLRLKKVPHIDFLELHGEQAKISKRRIKEKNCLLVGCNIWKNGVVDGMQHDASLDSSSSHIVKLYIFHFPSFMHTT